MTDPMTEQVVATIGGLALLVALALPALGLRLGPIETRTSPPTSTARRAYDLIADGFGPGFNGPLVLAAELPDHGDAAALDRLQSQLAQLGHF